MVKINFGCIVVEDIVSINMYKVGIGDWIYCYVGNDFYF